MTKHVKNFHPPGTAPGTLVAPPGESEQVSIHLLEYRGEEINQLQVTDVDHLSRELADGRPHGAVAWIHIIGLGNLNVLKALAEQFKLHPLALEDVVQLGQRPKVEDYDELVFITLQHLSIAAGELKTTQISLFLGDEFVLSFQPGGPDLLDSLRSRICTTHTRIRERNADYLVSAIIDLVVDTAFPVLEQFGEQLESLEEQIINRPDQQIMTSIYHVRRQLLGLRRVLWPQREVVGKLMQHDLGLLGDTVKVYLRDSSDHAVQAMDVVEAYREMAASLLDVHLSNTNNRLTDVMRVLTVIATLFTPPTFVASLYGMNFDRSSPWNMPELGWEYGYLMVWGIVIVMVAGMLVYFRRKHWL